MRNRVRTWFLSLPDPREEQDDSKAVMIRLESTRSILQHVSSRCMDTQTDCCPGSRGRRHFLIVSAFDRSCVHVNSAIQLRPSRRIRALFFLMKSLFCLLQGCVSSRLTSHTLCYCVPWNVSLTMTAMIISSKVSEYSSFSPLPLCPTRWSWLTSLQKLNTRAAKTAGTMYL